MRVCSDCCDELDESLFYINRGKPRATCKSCWKLRNDDYYEDNSASIITKTVNRKRDNPAQKRKHDYAERDLVRLDVLGAYADPDIACKHCGEIERKVLVLDHINGGGEIHRKEVSGGHGGVAFYRWIRKNNYPRGFQILCQNCNFIKSILTIRTDTPSKSTVRNRELRRKALEAYSDESVPICACCGESRYHALCIDHIFGGGNAHRRSIHGKTTASIYDWLYLNNYPPGFQVLCHNCNHAKSAFKGCPHQSPCHRIVDPMAGISV